MWSSSTRSSSAESSPPACCCWSVPGELGINDLLVLRRLLGRTSVGTVARRRGGRRGEAVDDLLQVGGERPHAVEARLLLDRLPRVGDELLGARLFIHR